MSTALWIALAIVLVACYITWTAGRLDRLHAGVDARWAALDAQLVRRAATARGLLPLLAPGPERDRLEAASAAALEAGSEGREAIENDLTRALRQVVPQLPATPAAAVAKAELEAAVTRVGLARSFHNSAVHATRTVRRRRLPRALRLAGHRQLPIFFDVDDTALL
ncbi:MAG: hypothetical protein JWN31_436 [Frankiales bacterium]|nr:hypothetical protein [Frankiales bacterium]